MSVIVLKFGGSSVATPEHLRKVAAKVTALREAGHLPVVVVSAMGKTTDGLLSLASEVSGHPHRRELDMLLSTGERISMALLTMAIRDCGHEAISLTGSQAGIITTTDHNQARIIEVRPIRVHEALEKGRIVIVGGFAGVSTDKEVTTLGRGGSDTTAISLAAALDAPECWICSDVDGVYTADPRVVPEARKIDALSHGEVLEMGLRGAKVLAPEAIDYARRHGVTLHARASFTDGRGTVITHRPHPGVGRAVAVAGDRTALPVAVDAGTTTLSEFFAWLGQEGVRWKDARRHQTGSSARVELVVDTLNTPDGGALIADYWRSRAGDCVVHEDLRTATIVGEGIAEQAPMWGHATDALANLGIECPALVGNAWGLTAQVPEHQLDDVVRAWHGALPSVG
ncbi:MAG: aspartate kinase [Deltaproteobacteria bacterium]|nr:aspartate kinase [Deltaproteobacteria bacterium]